MPKLREDGNGAPNESHTRRTAPRRLAGAAAPRLLAPHLPVRPAARATARVEELDANGPRVLGSDDRQWPAAVARPVRRHAEEAKPGLRIVERLVKPRRRDKPGHDGHGNLLGHRAIRSRLMLVPAVGTVASPVQEVLAHLHRSRAGFGTRPERAMAPCEAPRGYQQGNPKNNEYPYE